MANQGPTWFERVEASAVAISLSSVNGTTTPPPPIVGTLARQVTLTSDNEIPLRLLLTLCEDALSGYSILYSKGWVSKIWTIFAVI